MKKSILFPASVAALALLSSCSGKLGALSADNFTVTPSPLEAHAQQVPATINGNFPEKYMKRKAVVTVTPVLRWNGGEVAGAPATFQGEKVEGNNQTISYKVGGNYIMRSTFPYQSEMAKSELYLTFDARVGKKVVEVPEVKIADGVIATSDLVKQTLKSAAPTIGEDAFKRTIQQQQTATIQFLLARANLRASELNSNNVQEFIAKLAEIQENPEGRVLNNVEVSAYASPDGKYSFNEKLAGKRESNSSDYVKKQLKKHNLETNVDGKYTAEDWEGFQELVSQSNLQDKELILRVLSMYSDPEEREREIRNISTVYKELADGILPQLRRARLTANYEIVGRSDEQIQAQFKENASQLSVEELLYAATLAKTPAEKEAIYTSTTKIYPKDYRAYNNLGVLAYEKGNVAAAADYLSQAQKIAPAAAEINSNLGLIALCNGKQAEAEQYLAKGSGAKGLNEALGALYITKGQYAQAASTLANTKSNTAALAQILNKDYSAASSTLNAVKNADAETSYLKALVGARTGDKQAVVNNLQAAIQKDPSLAARAAKDLEFIQYASDLSGLLK